MALLTSGFAAIGMNRLVVLLALIFASAYAARRFPENRGFAFAAVLLTGSLVGFFLGYFADAMDAERHVWVPVLTLTLGFVALVSASVDVVVARVTARSGMLNAPPSNPRT
jgi:F0F1-type ATP synthase assembly protein I